MVALFFILSLESCILEHSFYLFNYDYNLPHNPLNYFILVTSFKFARKTNITHTNVHKGIQIVTLGTHQGGLLDVDISDDECHTSKEMFAWVSGLLFCAFFE